MSGGVWPVGIVGRKGESESDGGVVVTADDSEGKIRATWEELQANDQ